MNSDVDLTQLAVERNGTPGIGSGVVPRRHLVSRYVVPAALLLGAGALVFWAAFDWVFPARPVTVVPVLASRSDSLQEGTPLFKAAGWIEPRPTPVHVAALSPGVVQQLLVVEGQAVKAGEPIAELIKADAQLAFQRAQVDLKLRQAELEACRATLEAARTRFEQPVHLEATLAQAEAELAKVETELADLPFEIQRAEATLDYAKRNFEGKSSATSAVAGRALDQARSEHAAAETFVEELHRRVISRQREQTALARRRSALQKQLELRSDELRAKNEAAANVDAASARVQQAEVMLAEAKLQLDRMTVVAPVDGRVLQLIAHPGSRLMVGRGSDESHDASTVVTLYRPESLQVRVDVRFEDLPAIRPGQTASISSPAVEGAIPGKVLSIGSEADIQKNTLPVKVAIDAPPDALKPEMLVDVTFLAPKVTTAEDKPSAEVRIYIPQQYIETSDGTTCVWVADETAGVARRISVELGRPGKGGMTEVRKGLNVTSRLIATGTEGLRDGDRIRVLGDADK